ncbi:baseplate-related protein [Alteromonas phage vB_AemP_PT15-A5]|nr:baseplate-related protein [Alteromonas phage vB_AemP_PT15-A5]
MTILKSPLNSALRSSFVEGAASSVGRYFTYFNSDVPMYISFPSQLLSLDSTWQIELTAAVSAEGGYLFAQKESTDTVDRLGLYPADDGRIFGLSTQSPSAGGDLSTYLGTSKLTTFMATSDKTDLIYIVDGVEKHRNNVGLRGPQINSAGSPYAGSTSIPYIKGFISEVKITVDDDLKMHLVLDGVYDESNNTVVDLSGKGNHGAVVGASTGVSKMYYKNAEGDWENGSDVLKIS